MKSIGQIGKFLVVGVMAVSVGAFAEEFKAGFARVDITPPLGSFMPGYYQERHAKETLDPLQINMVAFSDGKTAELPALCAFGRSQCRAYLQVRRDGCRPRHGLVQRRHHRHLQLPDALQDA